MRLKPIANEQEYDYWLGWVDRVLDNPPHPDSKEGNKLHIVLLLIKDYEDKVHPVPQPDIKQTTLNVARRLHQELGIPAEILLS